MCAINMAEFATFGSLVAFFLPLVIMFIMYTLTIRMLRKQARAVSHMIEHASSNSSTYPSAKPEYTKRTGSLGDSGGPTGIERSTLRIEYSELTNHFEGLSLAATDDEASMTDSIRSVLLTRSPSVRRAWPSNGKCPCEQQQGGGVQHRWAASLPLAKALQQVQVLAGVGAMIVNRSTNQSVEAHLLKKRYEAHDRHVITATSCWIFKFRALLSPDVIARIVIETKTTNVAKRKSYFSTAASLHTTDERWVRLKAERWRVSTTNNGHQRWDGFLQIISSFFSSRCWSRCCDTVGYELITSTPLC